MALSPLSLGVGQATLLALFFSLHDLCPVATVIARCVDDLVLCVLLSLSLRGTHGIPGTTHELLDAA